jgi:hypothetical protein
MGLVLIEKLRKGFWLLTSGFWLQKKDRSAFDRELCSEPAVNSPQFTARAMLLPSRLSKGAAVSRRKLFLKG